MVVPEVLTAVPPVGSVSFGATERVLPASLVDPVTPVPGSLTAVPEVPGVTTGAPPSVLTPRAEVIVDPSEDFVPVAGTAPDEPPSRVAWLYD